MAEFIKHEDQWRCYWILSEEEKVAFKLRLFAYWLEYAELEVLDNRCGGEFYTYDKALEYAAKWTEHQYKYLIESLTTDEEHCGDCRKQCTSCIKCQAEEIWSKVYE